MSNGQNSTAETLKDDALLTRLEAGLDRNYHRFPLPHPNKTLATWYILSVAEDFLRNLFIGKPVDAQPASVEFYVDRLKYSLRFGLERILRESADDSLLYVPQRIVPMLYERAGRLLSAGIDFMAANQICSSAHAGTVSLIERERTIQLVIDEQQHDSRYVALELMGHQPADAVDHAALLFALLRLPDFRPPVLEWIADTVTMRNRLITYRYRQDLAILLAQAMHQPQLMVPDGWEFRWGGRAETTLLLNALAVRCLYHIVAVHFGAARLELRGGGEANICLVLAADQLAKDLELMSSLSLGAITAFVAYLTYGHDMLTPDPALQPLVPVGPGVLCVSCIHFLSSNHERNLLSLQARVEPTQFNSQSKLFELEMVTALEATLRARWPMMRTNIELNVDGSAEEVDLLILDAQTHTLLVCELRWMLGPGDPREVQNRKRVCWEKVDQLERKVRWIQARVQAILQQAFAMPQGSTLRAYNVIGVVVIEGFGGARSTKPEFPIMPTALFALGMENVSSLLHFSTWSKALAWLPQAAVHFNVVPQETDVDGATLRSFGIERLTGREAYRDHVAKTLLSTR